jgi:hypothetical protein
MKTRIYYTAEYRFIGEDEWKRRDRHFVRGIDIAGEFREDGLEELHWLVDTVHGESCTAEYRIIKVTETTEAVYTPPPISLVSR